jgi:hypothetical protein
MRVVLCGNARRENRPRRTCEDNIKVDLRNVGWDDNNTPGSG